jgi:hypothetical protein
MPLAVLSDVIGNCSEDVHILLKLPGPFFMETGYIQRDGIQWMPCQR